MAHIELALNSEVYVEQMALVTGLNELFARDEIRRNLSGGRFDNVRDTFLRYILKIDAARVVIPKNPIYSQLEMARRQMEGLAPSRGRRKRRGLQAEDGSMPKSRDDLDKDKSSEAAISTRPVAGVNLSFTHVAQRAAKEKRCILHAGVVYGRATSVEGVRGRALEYSPPTTQIEIRSKLAPRRISETRIWRCSPMAAADRHCILLRKFILPIPQKVTGRACGDHRRE